MFKIIHQCYVVLEAVNRATGQDNYIINFDIQFNASQRENLHSYASLGLGDLQLNLPHSAAYCNTHFSLFFPLLCVSKFTEIIK